MNKTLAPAKPFTGYHMWAWLIAFFGVVIGVNIGLAYFANSTWSGLVVENSYVASQEFNGKLAEVKAQDALGWKGTLSASNGSIKFALAGPDGSAVAVNAVSITLRRPVTANSDFTLALAKGGDGTWSAAHTLADGAWIAEIDVASDADKLAGTKRIWRDTLRLSVKDGAIQ